MYHVKWIVKGKVVLLRPVGDQTIDTLEDGINRLVAHYDEGDAPVHVIVDNYYLERFPTNPKTLSKFKMLSGHPNSGYTVSIGDNQMSRLISMMLAREFVEFRETLAEALAFLTMIDSTLPEELGYEDNPIQAYAHQA